MFNNWLVKISLFLERMLFYDIISTEKIVSLEVKERLYYYIF